MEYDRISKIVDVINKNNGAILEANIKANAVSKSTLHRVGINRLGFILSAISLDFLNEVNVS
jgi:hypothetical protein